MMGRNHIITGALCLGWAASGATVAGVQLFDHPEAVVLASGLFLWGTTAPDLDAEAAVASSTWAPKRYAAGARQERLLPSARSMAATITPGAHWLSAGMRVIARRHYHLTRGPGDPEGNDDPHRKLWHTAQGAAVLAAVTVLLLSPVPLLVAQQWWPQVMAATTADGRWWLPWLTAAPWAGLMFGVVFRGYFGERIGKGHKAWSSRAAGFAVGVLAALVCGWTGALSGAWFIWALAIWLGCGVHVAGDKCSRHGASWWAPMRQDEQGRRWRATHLVGPALRFRTGYGGESLFVLGLIVFSLLGWWFLLSAGGVLTGRASLFWVLEALGRWASG